MRTPRDAMLGVISGLLVIAAMGTGALAAHVLAAT
jgi:hypothetical protein